VKILHRAPNFMPKLKPEPIPELCTDTTKLALAVMEEYQLNTVAPNSARAYAEAEAEGLAVVLPLINEIQIDIDDEHSYEIYESVLPIISKYYGILDVHERESRSGYPKRHITLTLGKTVNQYERIALQLALGSDRIREVLGIVQANLGDPSPTLFLEKKCKECDREIGTGHKMSCGTRE